MIKLTNINDQVILLDPKEIESVIPMEVEDMKKIKANSKYFSCIQMKTGNMHYVKNTVDAIFGMIP